MSITPAGCRTSRKRRSTFGPAGRLTGPMVPTPANSCVAQSAERMAVALRRCVLLPRRGQHAHALPAGAARVPDDGASEREAPTSEPGTPAGACPPTFQRGAVDLLA